jgi:hypothetical protein
LPNKVLVNDVEYPVIDLGKQIKTLRLYIQNKNQINTKAHVSDDMRFSSKLISFLNISGY